MIPWIMGRSGVGKTHVANSLALSIRAETKFTPFVIDGDVLREAYGNDLGFTLKDRMEQASRAMTMALSLRTVSKGLIFPIVGLITPHESIQKFVKDNGQIRMFYRYRELQTIASADPKCLYMKDEINRNDPRSVWYFDDPHELAYGIDYRQFNVLKAIREIGEELNETNKKG